MIKRVQRPAQLLLLCCGLFVLSMSALLGMTQSRHVYADNPQPKTPFIWADTGHSFAADANGVKYDSAGYVCLDGSQMFKGHGTGVTVHDTPSTDSDVGTRTFLDNAAYNTKFDWVDTNPQSGQMSEYCDHSSVGHAASYAWVTRYKSGTNYALLVLPCYGSTSGDPVDPKLETIRKVLTDRNSGTCAWVANIGGDGEAGNTTKFGKIEDIKIDPAAAAKATTDTGSNDDSGNGNECQIQDDMAWAECPVLNALNWFALKMDSAISALLTINTQQVFSQTSGYYKVWNSFRSIAVGLIVVAGLVMVFGQALGAEIMDAYTIRKVLPRLLIAAIGITLSWPILHFTVVFFNNLGNWVGDAITWPFGSLGNSSYQSLLEKVLGTTAIGLGGTSIVVTGFVLGSLTLGGLMSMIATVGLAMIVAFVTLTLRNMVVIICIASAPLAIAAYILPGTKKMWDLWRGMLTTALVMFPLVMILLASGRIMASVSFSGSDTGDTNMMYTFLGLLAYITPYFLLPLMFKAAGGFISFFTREAQKRSSGYSKGLKKRRQELSKETKERHARGERWDEQSLFSRMGGNVTRGIVRRGNRIGVRRAQGATLLRRPPITAGNRATNRQAVANTVLTSANAYARKNTNFAAQMNDEDAMVAHAFGNNRAALRRLRHFQLFDEGGNMVGVDEAAIDRAITGSRTIRMTEQSQSAASEALAMSGKVIQTRQEADMLFDAQAHGNSQLRTATKNRDQKTWREVGRNDIGRDSDEFTLREMNMGHVTRLKPIAADNIFGTHIARNADGSVQLDTNGRARRESGILNAIRADTTSVSGRRTRVTDQQRQHYADLLFAAQYNPYTTAEQQASIQESIRSLQGDAQYGHLLNQAQQNYLQKMAPGGNLSDSGFGFGAPPPGMH